MNIAALSSDTLPVTGQLSWPVPVLALAGIALILVGLFLQKRS